MALNEGELVISADDGTGLSGTLTRSDTPGPHPVALLLSPGALDRNGNAPKAGLNYGEPIAAALADRGIACYRFDRRGVGHTPGDQRDVTWARHREDALTVVRTLLARDDLGPLALIGYSEGALNSAWLASRADITAATLIGCPARTGEQAMLWWAERLRPDELPLPIRLLLRLLRRTPREQIARMCAALIRKDERRPRMFGVRVPRSYRDYLLLDPVPDFKAITIPLLVLTGSKDRNIAPDDVDVIASLVRGPVEARQVPGLTHLLRIDHGPGSIRAYAKQYGQPTDPGLIEQITTWTARQLSQSPANQSRDADQDHAADADQPGGQQLDRAP